MKISIFAFFFLLPVTLVDAQSSAPQLLPLVDQGALDQEAERTNAPTTSNETDGFIRVWTLVEAEIPGKQFGAVGKLNKKLGVVKQGGTGEPLYLISNPYPYMLSGYATITPGKHKIALVDIEKEGAPPIETLEVEVTPSSFHTLIILRNGEEYSLNLIADTVSSAGKGDDLPKVQPAVEGLVVYNSLEGSSTALVSENPPIQKVVASGVTGKIEGLPRNVINMKIATKVAEEIHNAEVEVNLRDYNSLTCVIIKDLYGRVVPALLPNAVNE